jgi:arylsulfatase A-like enzyme
MLTPVPQELGPACAEPGSRSDSSTVFTVPKDAQFISLFEHLEFADRFHPNLQFLFRNSDTQLRLHPRNAWNCDPNGCTPSKREGSLSIWLPKESAGYHAYLAIQDFLETVDLSVSVNEGVWHPLSRKAAKRNTIDLPISEYTKGGGYFFIHFKCEGHLPCPRFQSLSIYPNTPKAPHKQNQSEYQVTVQQPHEQTDTLNHLADGPKSTLKLPAEGGGIVWHLWIPQNTVLTWEHAIEALPSPRCRLIANTNNETTSTCDPESFLPLELVVRIANESGLSEVLFVENFHSSFPQPEKAVGAVSASRRRPQHNLKPRLRHQVDLSAYAGQIVRLEFWTVGGKAPDNAMLIEPRLERKTKLPEHINWQAPDNVIVWLADTLRWDRIRAFTSPQSPMQTPHMDRLALEGILFKNAISQGNWSKPSQAAIMSGLYPEEVGMVDAREQRKPGTTLIGDALHQANDRIISASYSSNGYVSNAFGFDQYWTYSVNTIREGKANRTEYLLNAMQRDFDRDHIFSGSFFVWLGTIDAHVAYNPRIAFLDLYDSNPYHGPVNPHKTHELLLNIRTGKVKMSDRDWSRLFALYHGEISYNDSQLGRMIDMLDRWEITPRTAIIVVADHGEAFMEHGNTGHGGSLYDEQVRVPLFINYPSGFNRALVVTDAVETRAIFGTVMKLFGLTDDAVDDARPDLVRYCFGAAPLWPKPAISQFGSQLKVAIGTMRLLKSRSNAMVFDTQIDPYESDNLIDKRPDIYYYLNIHTEQWNQAKH